MEGMAAMCSNFSPDLGLFYGSFLSLLRAINPLAVALLFLAAFGHYGRGQRKAMARTACWVAMGLFLAFALWGRPILQTLGTGIPSIYVACGIILATVGFRILCAGDCEETAEDSSGGAVKFSKGRPNMAVIPLAVPLIAGPKPLSVAMGSGLEISGCCHKSVLLLGVVAAVAAVYFSLRIGSALCSILSTTLRKLFFRIGGLILLALAFQHILIGLAEIEPFSALLVR
jgi:multiple antibiotic resistance protein